MQILSVILAVVVLAAIAFFGLYFTRIRTFSSIEQLTDYEDGYNLYRMDVQYDYNLDNIINYGITDDQTDAGQRACTSKHRKACHFYHACHTSCT